MRRCVSHLSRFGRPRQSTWTFGTSRRAHDAYASSSNVQVGNLTDEQKAKIKELSSKEVPIEVRRTLYNKLGRRFDNPVGLKPGLLGAFKIFS